MPVLILQRMKVLLYMVFIYVIQLCSYIWYGPHNSIITTVKSLNANNNNINNHTWDGVRMKNNAMGENKMYWYHFTLE